MFKKGNKYRFKKGHKCWWLGKRKPPFSEEWRRHMSEAHKNKPPNNAGMEVSKESRKRMSKSQKIKWEKSSDLKKRFSLYFTGKGNPNWRGGISFEPYSVNWTETLKKSIRERDKYTCQVCGKEPATHIHHIDYDKKNCCPKNLITLCHSCHMKTSYKRNYWVNYFKNNGNYNY